MTENPELGRCLAVFGTASDVGKSLITAGLCRILSDRGANVAPYKAQNMSNNSGVTRDGKEMGRAQIVQAAAARTEPHVDMNPVLLKPSTEDGSQVILLGQPWGQKDAKSYFAEADQLKVVAYEALTRLRKRFDCVVIEGAGSCAEVNLRSREYVNFPCAHFAEAAVILVADIDRGGVFAQVVGSLEVMNDEDRARVCGIIINRFRGDRSLFDDGVEYLEKRTGLPVLGVVPYLMGLNVESEDSLQRHATLDPPHKPHKDLSPERIRIAVVRLPHISNSTDFDPLLGLSGVDLHFLTRPRALTSYDLVLLPGSKNVRADLAWLREVGWEAPLLAARNSGCQIGGICGGYQILGERVCDPEGVESSPGISAGLGYLPVESTLQRQKIVTRVSGYWARDNSRVEGYEIHMGESRATASDSCRPSIVQDNQKHAPEPGLSTHDGRVWGTYMHGLFDSQEFLTNLLAGFRPRAATAFRKSIESLRNERKMEIDRFADVLRTHLDLTVLDAAFFS